LRMVAVGLDRVGETIAADSVKWCFPNAPANTRVPGGLCWPRLHPKLRIPRLCASKLSCVCAFAATFFRAQVQFSLTRRTCTCYSTLFGVSSASAPARGRRSDCLTMSSTTNALLLTLVAAPQLASCLDNGVGALPAMGWNPWNCFGTLRGGMLNYDVPWAHGYNDSVIRTQVDMLVETNLSKAGYEYIQLDCGWTTGYRDEVTGAWMVSWEAGEAGRNGGQQRWGGDVGGWPHISHN
jgi:hypothetical protein